MGIDLVIKIGSMALIRREDNDIDYNIFARLSGELRPGMLLVSSGATEIGRLDYMKRTGRTLTGDMEQNKTDYAAQGQAILIGNAIGAGRREEALLTSKRMLFVVECMSLVTAAGIITLRYPILSLFRHLSAASIDSAARLLLIASCVMPVRFFNTINIVGILRAGGDTIFSMALDAGSVWIIGVPCVAIATLLLGWPIEGVFAATCVEEVVKLAAGLTRFLSGKWINNLTTIGRREEQA